MKKSAPLPLLTSTASTPPGSQEDFSRNSPTEMKEKGAETFKNNLTQSTSLTPELLQAFKGAFDLFDSDGTGTINDVKLRNALESVGFFLHDEEITAMMGRPGVSENGEIDFGEFLDMLTNTDMILEAFGGRGQSKCVPPRRKKDVLLFDAFRELVKKSSLENAHEIDGYYQKTYKRVARTYSRNKGVHVVGHYADGARLAGLTENQLLMQLKQLQLNQTYRNEKDKDSPYAKPVRLLMPDAAATKKKKMAQVRTQRRDKRPKIYLYVDEKKTNSTSVYSPSIQDHPSQPTLSQHDDEREDIDLKPGRESETDYKPGWISQRNVMYNVDISLPFEYRDVQVDRLPNLRKKVEEAKARFVKKIAEKKIQRNICHYRELRSKSIPSSALNQQFITAFSAYSCAETNNRTSVTISRLNKARRTVTQR